MKKKITPVVWALVCAYVILFFCTKSSPAYPVNDWSDANIYLTIGRGMTHGKVVYRDLYDHKGPLLYALHAACALVSGTDFLGVFVMEGLLLAWFLHSAWRILRLWGLDRASWVLLPLLGVLICSSVSFSEGDSAEEMLLPLMASAMAAVFAFLKSREGRMRAKTLFIQGFFTGCVFWIKFTMVGLHAGLLGWVLLRHLIRKEWKAFFQSAGWLIAGFAASTAPWVLYFGFNGALMDWLKVYLWDNLFLYSGESTGLLSRFKAMAVSGWGWLWDNLRYTVWIAAGLLWFAFRERSARAALWLSAVLGALLVFIGGKSYPYYGLALAGLAISGMIPLGMLLEKRLPKWAAPAALALCAALCPLISFNMTADYGAPFASARQDTMQHRIAAHMPQGASMLNYGFMDAGFYLAAGAVPEVKYFHQTNVPLEEMLSEQKRYVDEAVCEYVVARRPLSDHQLTRYELIAQEKSPNFWYEQVYLYRRTK